MRRSEGAQPAIPEAELKHFQETALNAHLAARAGFVGIASCLLEAARRRAARAESAGEPWAAALIREWAAASEQLRARYEGLE